MKIKTVGTAIVIGLIVYGCASSKNQVTYIFPKEMKDTIRLAYLEQCKKGEILYTLNCSACHDSISGKKRFIPDFSPEQLSGYEFRFANRSHENNLNESKITQEELVTIITFLTYKSKSNYLPKFLHKDSSELDRR